MRILYIITQGEQGGGQKYVLDLATSMQKAGHEIFVAIGKIENTNDIWLFEALEKMGIKKKNIFEIKNLQREIKPILEVKSLFEIYKLYKKVRPDIAHLNSSKAGVVGAVAGFLAIVKTVYTVHGFVFLEPMDLFKKMFYVLMEFISAKLRNFTILISKKDIEAGKKYFILNKNSENTNYELIYNGIDTNIKENILSREEAREFVLGKIILPNPPLSREGNSAQVQIVGTVANFFKTKGLEYFIDAAGKIVYENDNLTKNKNHKNILFVVFGFGDGKYKQELMERINKNNLQNNFFLLGKVPNAYKYLKALDLFVLTSVKEGLPYSILEASLAGLSIVATNVGGIPEIADYINIDLISYENKNHEEKVLEIKNKILQNLEKPVWKKENKQKIQKEFPEIFKIENMTSQVERIYKSML